MKTHRQTNDFNLGFISKDNTYTSVEEVAEGMGISVDEVRSLSEDFSDIVNKEAVTFKTKTWLSSNSMNALDFHMPFDSMRLFCDEHDEPILIFDNPMSIRKQHSDMKALQDFIVIAGDKKLLVTIWDSGEIEVIDANLTTEQFEYNQKVTIVKADKQNYIFVYNILSTIDYINNAEYVVTDKKKQND